LTTCPRIGVPWDEEDLGLVHASRHRGLGADATSLRRLDEEHVEILCLEFADAVGPGRREEVRGSRRGP